MFANYDPKANKDNAINQGGRLEATAGFVVVAFYEDGTSSELVTVRTYQSRRGDGASPVYAAVWINGKYAGSGRGRVGGGGYDKNAAAIMDALNAADWTFTQRSFTKNEWEMVSDVAGVGYILVALAAFATETTIKPLRGLHIVSH